MLKYYVLRRDEQFKIAHIDSNGADLLHRQGWELGQHPYDTQKQAEQAMAEWKKNYARILEIEKLKKKGSATKRK